MGAYDIVTLVTLVAIAACGTVGVVALYNILRESVSHRRAMRENTGDGILPHGENSVLLRKCDKVCLDCLGIKSVAARDLDECTERVGYIPVHVCAHLKRHGGTVAGVNPDRRQGPALERRVDRNETPCAAVETDLPDDDRHVARIYYVDDMPAETICLHCLVKGSFCVRPMAYKVDGEVHHAKRTADNRDGQRNDVCD